MHVYITRHGETNYNILDICTSDPAADAYLTDVGITQSQKLAAKLKKAPIEHIFVSRLKRTQQTAGYINKGRDIPITIDARLDDNRSGFDGRPTKEHTAFLQASEDAWNARFNSGESWDDVCKRVTEFLAELSKRPHKTVLIVTSMSIVQMTHLIVQNLPHEQYGELQVDRGSCFELDI